MKVSEAVDLLTNAFDTVKVPAKILPPVLLKCSALTRQGLSAYRLAADVIRNCKSAGIDTEPGPNGEENLINKYSYALSKAIVDALKNDASVQVAIPMQSLLIQANGANAGGPVVATGTNLLDSIGNGIIQ
jgi:hypothetical protein